MGKSKSKSTTNSTQSTTNTPFGPAMPGLTDLANLTSQAMWAAQGVPQYTGDFIALPGQMQQAVIPAYQNSAALAGQLGEQALGVANNQNWQMPTFSGPGLEAGTQSFASYDPTAVAPVVQAALQPYMRQLTEQILPGMQSSAIESGAYSNDRAFAVMPELALRDTGRMAAEVASGIAFQDFLSQQERNLEAYGLSTQRGLGEADVLTSRIGMYPELLDSVMRMSTGQAGLTEQAAAYDTAMRQAEIQNALARDAYAVQAPFRGLDMAANLFGTFAPYSSSNMTGRSTTTQTTSQPLAGQILQGALGVGSMVAGFPGLGTALGLGGAAGAAANPMLAFAGNTMPNFSSAPWMQPIPNYAAQLPQYRF